MDSIIHTLQSSPTSLEKWRQVSILIKTLPVSLAQIEAPGLKTNGKTIMCLPSLSWMSHLWAFSGFILALCHSGHHKLGTTCFLSISLDKMVNSLSGHLGINMHCNHSLAQICGPPKLFKSLLCSLSIIRYLDGDVAVWVQCSVQQQSLGTRPTGSEKRKQ